MNLKGLFNVRPELFSCVVHLVSADMNTSQGEPEVICVYRELDESGLTIIWQLFAALNVAVMLATTLVRLDAMKTRRSTGCGAAVGVGVVVGVAVDVAVGVADCIGLAEAVGVGVVDGVGEELPLDENVPLYAK